MRGQFLGIAAARGLGSALQAVAIVVFARAVAPEVFGAVSVVIAVVGIVLVVTGMGMSVYVPRARARGEHDEVAAGLRLNSWSNLATATVGVAALGLWAALGSLPLGAVLIGLSLSLERNVDTYLGVPVADGDARVSVVSMVARRSVSLAVLGAGLVAGVDPVWAYSTGLLAGALVAQWHVRRAVGALPGSAAAVGLRGLLSRAWPFLVANVTAQVRTLDVTVVAAVLHPAATGMYAAASKLVQPLLLVPQALAAVVTPHSTRLDPARARRLGLRLVAVFGAFGLLAVPMALLAEPITRLVLGADYAGAAPALAWGVIGLPFLAMASSLGALLQGQGRERLVAVNGLVLAPVLLGAVAVGAAVGGIAGAAIGFTASYVVRAGVLVVAVAALSAAPPDGVRPDG